MIICFNFREGINKSGKTHFATLEPAFLLVKIEVFFAQTYGCITEIYFGLFKANYA